MGFCSWLSGILTFDRKFINNEHYLNFTFPVARSRGQQWTLALRPVIRPYIAWSLSLRPPIRPLPPHPAPSIQYCAAMRGPNRNEHCRVGENIFQTMDFYTMSAVILLSRPSSVARSHLMTEEGVCWAPAPVLGAGSVTNLQFGVLHFKICSWFSKHCMNMNIHQKLGPLAG